MGDKKEERPIHQISEGFQNEVNQGKGDGVQGRGNSMYES